MLVFDFETGSSRDLRTEGLHAYVTDPSTWVVMVAWVECEDRTCSGKCNHKTYTYFADHNNLDRFKKALDKHRVLYAYNSGFDMSILNYVMGIDRYVRCIQILTRLSNIPKGVASSSSLNSYCKYLGLGEKLDSGAVLMKYFNQDKATTLKNIESKPDKYETYKEYCIRDAKLAYEVLKKLPMVEYDFLSHEKTLQMNRRGLNIDLELLDKLCEIKESEEIRITEDITRITKGVCTAKNQYGKLAEFLGVKSVSKEALPKLKPRTKARKELVEVLKDASMGSLAKAPKIKESLVKGRAHDFIEFGAARTGRFGGRGLQIQNLPKTGYDEEDIAKVKDGSHTDSLINQGKSCLRGLIHEDMTVVDYASIENRMIAWLIRDSERLELFRNGGDDYKALASKIFNVPESEVTKEQRTVAKPIVLGCMYGGGVNAIAKTMDMYGLTFTQQEMKKYLAVYRSMYQPLLNETERLANRLRLVVQTNKPHMSAFRCDLKIETIAGITYLRVVRPSGRSLWYPDIRWVTYEDEDRREGVYYGVGYSLYYGNLANNITQACAADVLLDGIHKLAEEDLNLLFTVHDEFVVEGHHLDKVLGLLSKPPSWCEDLPLGVEGDELKRYGKV